MRIFIGKSGIAALAVAVPLALPATASAAPDLKVSIGSVSPQPATPGSQVTARTRLSNTGAHAADLNQRRGSYAVHMVRWFFKERGTGPDKFVLATSMMGTLAPGGVKNINARFKIPADAKPGMHTICAVADPANRIRESSEGNNRHCIRIRVKPGATAAVPAKPAIKPGVKIAKPPAVKGPVIKPGVLQRQCINPAIVDVQAGIIRRDRNHPRTQGTIQIKAVLKNIGNADYVSGANQQSVQIHSGRSLLKNEAFGNLRAGETKIIAIILPWNTATEFQSPVTASIVYDPDIRLDSNPRNDDCRMNDNKRAIQPDQINRLFGP